MLIIKARRLAGAAVLSAATMSSTIASAQSSLEIPLQFDFVNPGAKSLALGGAFTGIADDATAAFANPAGLTLLLSPEVSGDFRFSRIKTTYLEGGRLSGQISNEGIDHVQGPMFGENIGSRFGTRYAAFVYPHPSHKWVIAGYRHELARLSQRGSDAERIASGGVFQQDPTESISHRESPHYADRAISITGYGVSGAYKPRRNVSIGVGVTRYSFALDSTTLNQTTNGFYGETIYDDDARFNWVVHEGKAIAFAPTFGLTVDRGRTRVGVVYRRGASFDFTTWNFVNTERHEESVPRSAAFRVPHTLGVGMSMRATARLLVSAEVTHIAYSRLVNDFIVEQARPSGQQDSFRIDNATEVHVSAQYAWGRLSGSPVRFRAGAWHDPDHSVRYRAARTPTTVDERLFDERFAAALSKGTGQTHLTGGAGVTLGSRVEVNAGLDIAKLSRQISTSVIVHVGRTVQ